ncbi:hypothetical protein [Microlunatus phosphovorus]|nr:hypothetical protein [Microlunatus phosphovorus]
MAEPVECRDRFAGLLLPTAQQPLDAAAAGDDRRQIDLELQ